MTGIRTKTLRTSLASVAPEIARALGGPFAGAATSLLARKLLGKSDVDAAALAAAVDLADPAALARIREADHEFRQAVLREANESERIAAGDRDSARARERALKDRVPGALAFIIVSGFFSILAVMLVRDVPQGSETEFSIMLGALATMAAAVMNYYFGSSASSREKTRMLDGRRLPGGLEER